VNSKICPVCGSRASYCFDSQILDKHRAEYFDCRNCGYLFIADPSWLQEAYSEAVSTLDTGVMSRNLNASSFFSLLFFLEFRGEKTFLDYSGGYGILTRLMRDCGFDYFWTDLYCANLLARGFEVLPEQKIFLTTALECFEHFENPIEHFEKIFSVSENLIISTELLPENRPAPPDWHYYCLNTGQHIGFFRPQALDFIARKFGKLYCSVGSYHFFMASRISQKKLKTLEFISRKFPVYKFVQKLNGNLCFEDAKTLNQFKNKESLGFKTDL
jgi:hypothetical protein